jgi:hypothetical protein
MNVWVPFKTGEFVSTDVPGPTQLKKKVKCENGIFKTGAGFFVESAVRRRWRKDAAGRYTGGGAVMLWPMIPVCWGFGLQQHFIQLTICLLHFDLRWTLQNVSVAFLRVHFET